MKTYGRLYGSALPLTLTMERTVFGSARRGAGLKSSMLGLEILMDRMNELHPEDIFGCTKEKKKN
jgi:hypothetical protein